MHQHPLVPSAWKQESVNNTSPRQSLLSNVQVALVVFNFVWIAVVLTLDPVGCCNKNAAGSEPITGSPADVEAGHSNKK